MDNCLFISDMHMPFQHRDAFKFLEAVADVYDIKIVKSVGDLVDNHNSSYHEIVYGILSAKDEYKQALKGMTKLAGMFPEMTVTIGNHDSLGFRKAQTIGIAEDALKSYNDVWGVDWNWVDHDYFKINKYQNCLVTHNAGVSTLQNAKVHSHCTVQGHHHGVYGIEYFADTDVLRWAMTVGCLVDPHSRAFNYAKGNTTKRPILGVGGIIEDLPILMPMQLAKSGRWVGVV